MTLRNGGVVRVRAGKLTKFVTNPQAIDRERGRTCDGSHEHHHLIDGRAKGAAKYLKPYVSGGSKFFVAKVDALVGPTLS